MAIITDANRRKVQELFDRDLQDPLQILVFYVDTEGDELTGATRQLVGELAALSGGRLTVRELELQASPDDARTYGIDRVPALVFLDRDGRDQGFRFLGAPVGYEFMALLDDIVDVSRRKTRLTDAVRAKIQSIQQELLIQVFSTPT